MGFLDKAKKLAEQAAEKAGPLIDKAAPHAQTVVEKAGQQIDKRTDGKYRDKIEAVETKIGELADKRLGRAGADQPAAAANDAFPDQPAAAANDAFPDQPAAAANDAFPDQPAAGSFPRSGAGRAERAPGMSGADAGFGATPAAAAQPDVGGQPDEPAFSPTPSDAGPRVERPSDQPSEPVFTTESAEITFPAPPPETTFSAEPDSTAGQPDDVTSSAGADRSEYPGLSEGPADTSEVVEREDRSHPGASG